MGALEAPFPYFGGKSRCAPLVWERFGDVPNYIEPFFGSGAMLLARPHPEPGIETVNDKCGFVANFWRALQHAPDEVARHADNPVNENDLPARHAWLVRNHLGTLAPKLEGDPEWYDAKVAGWWVWGMACWIGSGFCSGRGPWQSVNGELVRDTGTAGRGVRRQRVHLGNAGQGVRRQRVHLGDYFQALADRLRNVRVCCGDWSRVCGPTVLFAEGSGPVAGRKGPTAVFLDPPYTAEAGRTADLYSTDCLTVGHEVCRWAIEQGEDTRLRIAVCGYAGEYAFPDSWECVAWKTAGGYGLQGDETAGRANSHRERIWFSPGCLRPAPDPQGKLW